MLWFAYSPLNGKAPQIETKPGSPRKLERLFGVVTLSFLISYSWGDFLATNTELRAGGKRKSIFRLGLESLMEIFDKGLGKLSAVGSDDRIIDENLTLIGGSAIKYHLDI